jgi:hypothetical protein
MARALPSVVPPKMYRHFALVTVLLTLGVAMFADGENREAAAAQVEQRETSPVEDPQVIKPPIARRPVERHQRSHESSAFDGFDPSFGAPMDTPRGSPTGRIAAMASAVAQTGYSDSYLASLDSEKRALLLAELEKEGLSSPEERERKTAALVAASETRSGRPTANY